MARPWQRILIANRGEIACRVIETIQSLGYEAVAVYSEADAAAPHTQRADVAIPIGPTAASESYLSVEKLITAAQESGSSAIHPGYGFLSENPALPEACAAAGLTFIGPSAEAIRLMGDKRAARIAVAARGVPCVPGYDGEEQSEERLIAEAERIGAPLMVKAAMGGGGKGMRLLRELGGLSEALAAAKREATAAFGSGGLILERAVERPRHIEVQIFADRDGNVVHLGERECSLQRRHQKVIEEAPSAAVDETLRARLGAAAVEVARAVSYEGAGTVEFLLGADGAFYFLEMNTRIQVEHPVTELIYGVDLVAWQIAAAEGRPIPHTQEALNQRRKGHAIEARLYAEDPARGFLPQAGLIDRWRAPSGIGIRVDEGIGSEVSPAYDPMLAKVIAFGEDREEARRRLLRALEELRFFGPQHNSAFLRQLLESASFRSAAIHTRSIDEELALAPSPRPIPALELQAVAVAALSLESAQGDGWGSRHRSRWPLTLAFNSEGLNEHSMSESAQAQSRREGQLIRRWWVHQNDHDSFTLSLATESDPLSGEESALEALTLHSLRYDDESMTLSWRGERGSPKRLSAFLKVGHLQLCDQLGHHYRFTDQSYARRKEEESQESDGRLLAPMSAKLLQLRCAEGAEVSAGEVLFIVEAMKLEHQIAAPFAGKVQSLRVQEGDQLSPRQLLAEIVPMELISTESETGARDE